MAVVIWSYPRGGNLSKDGETAIDVTAYAAHMAALLGAHIIKVKPPTDFIEQDEAKKVYDAYNIPNLKGIFICIILLHGRKGNNSIDIWE